VDDIDALLAIRAIERLKASYFRCMDTKDWARFEAVFTPDAVMDMQEEAGDLLRGAPEIAAYVRTQVGPVETVHHGHMPEIELTSDTTATGIWALHDIVIFPNGVRLDGYGHYHETYAKGADGWRISSLKLTRLHTDFRTPEEG